MHAALKVSGYTLNVSRADASKHCSPCSWAQPCLKSKVNLCQIQIMFVKGLLRTREHIVKEGAIKKKYSETTGVDKNCLSETETYDQFAYVTLCTF